MAACSIDQCETAASRGGLCQQHYVTDPARGTCSIEGCEGVIRVRSHGWCSKHYQRWQKTGDPLKAHHEYRTDNVGYEAVHTRLRNWRGLASEHLCACGKRAMDWAYLGGCPEEKIGKNGKYVLTYCVHIDEHYEAMCRGCHKRHDLPLHLVPVYNPEQPRIPKGSGPRSGQFRPS